MIWRQYSFKYLIFYQFLVKVGFWWVFGFFFLNKPSVAREMKRVGFLQFLQL